MHKQIIKLSTAIAASEKFEGKTTENDLKPNLFVLDLWLVQLQAMVKEIFLTTIVNKQFC